MSISGQVLRKINGVTLKNDCHLFYYRSSIDPVQSSGAYIFRPEKNDPVPIGKPKLSINHGALTMDLILTYSNWAEQKFRFFKRSPVIEHEFIVGELPRPGMELIFKLETDIESGNIFYTDINGRGEILRKLNYRETWELNQTEPVSGNYYPINSKIRIEDEKTGAQLAVFPDRAQGKF